MPQNQADAKEKGKMLDIDHIDLTDTDQVLAQIAERLAIIDKLNQEVAALTFEYAFNPCDTTDNS